MDQTSRGTRLSGAQTVASCTRISGHEAEQVRNWRRGAITGCEQMCRTNGTVGLRFQVGRLVDAPHTHTSLNNIDFVDAARVLGNSPIG